MMVSPQLNINTSIGVNIFRVKQDLTRSLACDLFAKKLPREIVTRSEHLINLTGVLEFMAKLLNKSTFLHSVEKFWSYCSCLKITITYLSTFYFQV